MSSVICAFVAIAFVDILVAPQRDSARKLQSLGSQDIILRLPDPVRPGTTVAIPSDERSFGTLDYEAERALTTQYRSVRDDIIRWFLAEPDRIGCTRYNTMRVCRRSSDGSYMSISDQAEYVCTQNELMLYAEAHVPGEKNAGIESLEDWSRIYATFLQHLGMTHLAADVRNAIRPSPVETPPSPPRSALSLSTVNVTSTSGSHEQPAAKRPVLFEVGAGTLVGIVSGACACGAASCACISRCRRTRGRRYQKLELNDLDHHDIEPLEQTSSAEHISNTASATDILRAYAKSKQLQETT